MAGSSDTPKVAGPVTLACPNCGAPVPHKAVGATVTLTCPSCLSIIDTSNEALRILQKANQKVGKGPSIPLYTRLKLKGVEWEVIGFIARMEPNWNVFWREYLLYNPLAGFRWLVESDGHWNFVTPQTNTLVEVNKNEPKYGGERFKVYNRGKAKVAFVLGEFYWRVQTGDTVETADFISPPHMLSYEWNNEELSVGLAEYVPLAELEAALNNKDIKLPAPQGISPNQPATTAPLVRLSMWVTILVTFLLMGGCIVFAPRHPAEEAPIEHLYTLTPADTARSFTVGPFKYEGGTENLEIVTSASLNNNWVSIQYTLANLTTGEVSYFTRDLEYYSGTWSEGGESGTWSEGENRNESVFDNMSDGEYVLTADLEGQGMEPGKVDPSATPIDVRVTVSRNTPVFGPVFIVLLVLWGVHIIVWIAHKSFEVRRWSNSDYSPYSSSE